MAFQTHLQQVLAYLKQGHPVQSAGTPPTAQTGAPVAPTLAPPAAAAPSVVPQPKAAPAPAKGAVK